MQPFSFHGAADPQQVCRIYGFSLGRQTACLVFASKVDPKHPSTPTFFWSPTRG